jgi:DNA primase
LGAKLSPNQKRIIDKLKIFTILCLYDSDSAGISNVDEIMRLCQNQYRVIPLYLPDGKDVGDMAPRYLRELINPLIDKYKEAI